MAPATSTRARHRTDRAPAPAGVELGFEQNGEPPALALEGWNGTAVLREEGKRGPAPAARPEVTVPEVFVWQHRFQFRLSSKFRLSRSSAVLFSFSEVEASLPRRCCRQFDVRERRFCTSGRSRFRCFGLLLL